MRAGLALRTDIADDELLESGEDDGNGRDSDA